MKRRPIWLVPLLLCIVAIFLQGLQQRSNAHGKVSFILLPLQQTIYIVQRPLGIFADWISGFFYSLVNGANLLQKVQSLEAELETTKQSQTRMRLLEEENRRLRQMLRMPAKFARKTVYADIVGFFPTERKILVNVGSRQNVRAGDPIISPEGLVGQIVQVSGNFSYGNLLTHPEFSVGARVQRLTSEAVGIVRGQGNNVLVLEIYEENANVQVNDLIVTSGLSTIYPEGIPIGIVTELWSEREWGIRRSSVLPSVNLHRLRQVVVLTR